MKIVKKYGKPAAGVLAGLGLLLIVSAFLFSPKSYTARIRTTGQADAREVKVTDRFAADWLLAAGMRLYPGDAIIYSGVKIDPAFKLPAKQDQLLLYKPGIPIVVTLEGEQQIFYSAVPTLGEALWEQNIIIAAGDSVSLPLDTPLSESLQVEIQLANPLTIEIGADTMRVSSAAGTVGEALADAGIALQDLDYSQPAEDQPVPSVGVIKVVRVREETILEETAIAFEEQRMADEEMAVGETEVRQTGVNGVEVSSVRVRFEDGEEVSRTVESEWISKQPVAQIVAYGSKVVIQTSSGNDCYVDYWLAKQVYITSYHDTGSPTASGVWPYYGVIAVSPDWYKILKGSSICVPGYGVGTVLDVCPGCTGKDWIDVFIPTADYVSWSKNLTVYFMPPVPSGFSGDLP